MSCNYLRDSGIVVVPGTSFTITVNNENLVDKKFYTLKLMSLFPAMIGTEAVSIVINGQTIPCVDRAGNVLRAGKLRSPCRYRIIYGGDTPHFLFAEPLCCMKYSAVPTNIEAAALEPQGA